MATGTKPSVVKIKPSDGSASGSRVKIDSSIKDKKKFENSIKQNVSHTKSGSSVSNASAKSEVKLKITSSSTKTTTKTPPTKVRGKREKKVYSLPGQKFDPPEEREPLRIFYESLLKQKPGSEMAEFWLMEHGLLSPERAKRAHEKKQRKQKQIRMGTPIKSPAPSSSKPVTSQKPSSNKPGTSQKSSSSKPGTSEKQSASKNSVSDTRTKKKLIIDDDDDEFILSQKRRKV